MVRAARPQGSMSPEAFLCPLFYAMGGYVPKILVDRATSSRKRSDEYGHAGEVTAHDTGMHEDLACFLFSGVRLQQAIRALISCSTLATEGLTDDVKAYVCQSEAARVSFEESSDYWIHRAFELCCYVFPRNDIIEPSYAQDLFPRLVHCLPFVQVQ
jgi:hypothetical protein